MLLIAPSILAADPLNLEREVVRMTAAGCDWLHVDVMDAHFVPNLSFSPATAAALHRRFPELPLDVHLMMDNPGDYLEAFARAGADGITIHAEIPGGPSALLRKIRDLGCRPGLSLKPGTPAERVLEFLPLCDLVLVMTVEPGFGGQHFMADMLPKLDALREAGFRGLIEADGGLDETTVPLLLAHGLDVAVMGTALFHSERPGEVMDGLRRQAEGL